MTVRADEAGLDLTCVFSGEFHLQDFLFPRMTALRNLLLPPAAWTVLSCRENDYFDPAKKKLRRLTPMDLWDKKDATAGGGLA
ncbi:unnamed protein product [Pleuronectes platessa]|uniref:Uncharacterized protein n=1 Tax=Pleuronectes platessa TaxID=8262 RepID=A0A9N7VBW1_PLEPL|nr:unnamed protein product [Pleuronectes platessa]